MGIISAIGVLNADDKKAGLLCGTHLFYKRRSKLLKVLEDEGGHSPVKVQAGIAAGNAMCAIRIEFRIIFFTGFDEVINKHHGILYMHIIVAGAMNEEEFAGEIGGHFFGGIVIITGGIGLRGAHITFGIDIIIVPPVGDRCYRDAHFKEVAAFEHTGAAHKSSKAPSPDTDPAFIDIGQCRQ